jgi:DNA-binding IscR family transcriptional regulator
MIKIKSIRLFDILAILLTSASCKPEETLTCEQKKKKIEEHYDNVLAEWRNQMTSEIYQTIMAEMQSKLEREVPECLD